MLGSQQASFLGSVLNTISPCTTFQMSVQSGRNLAAEKGIYTYVKITLLDEANHKIVSHASPRSSKTVSPEWNFTPFQGKRSLKKRDLQRLMGVKVEVYQTGWQSRHRFMGQIYFPLKSGSFVLRKQPYESWVALLQSTKHPNAVVSGEVFVTIVCSRDQGDDEVSQFYSLRPQLSRLTEADEEFSPGGSRLSGLNNNPDV